MSGETSKEQNLDLITIIVQHKDEKKLLWALKEAQAPGVTYFYGRGTGVRQRFEFLAGLIEAEKVVVMTAVPPARTDEILKAVTKAVDLSQPGRGFVCVQKVQRVLGYF